MIVYRLPENYFERYIGNIQAVTVEAVQKAAATYIQPGRFAVVIAGDRKAIETGLRALKLGEIRVLRVDEAIGS
jgi:predicted Zn-dependent peptidase